MKKNTILVLMICFVFASSNCFAQETGSGVKVKWGKEFSQKAKTQIDEVIGATDKHVYVIRENTPTANSINNKRFLESYSKLGNLTSSIEIPKKINNERVDCSSITIVNNQPYLFYSKFNKLKPQRKALNLYAQKLKVSTLGFEGKPLELINLEASLSEEELKSMRKRIGSFGFTGDRKAHTFFSSPNKEFLLIHENFLSKFKVYNKDFELLYEQELFDDKASKSSIIKIRIDNKGNAYFLLKHPISKKDRSKENKNHFKLEMKSYINEGKYVNSYSINLTENYISYIDFRVSNDGRIICSGFYTDSPIKFLDNSLTKLDAFLAFRPAKIKGIFYQIMDTSKEEIVIKTQEEFGKGVLSKFISEKKAEKGKGLPYFKMDDIIIRNDGSAVLLAEQYYIRKLSTTNTNRQTGEVTLAPGATYNEYHDILVVNIDPEGEISWVLKVPKDQSSKNDDGNYSSYGHMVHESNIYLLFNDHPKNLNPNSDKEHSFKGKRKSVAMVATISDDGNLKRKLISKNQEAGILVRPKTCQQISSNEMLIYAKWKVKNRVGILTIE